MMYILCVSFNELEMMILFMFMIVIFFLSVVFYIDFGIDGSYFFSIFDVFWWSVMIVSIVGYGDYYFMISFGKVVGGICVVFGVLVFFLLVMVFVKNFNVYLKGELICRYIESKIRCILGKCKINDLFF